MIILGIMMIIMLDWMLREYQRRRRIVGNGCNGIIVDHLMGCLLPGYQ